MSAFHLVFFAMAFYQIKSLAKDIKADKEPLKPIATVKGNMRNKIKVWWHCFWKVCDVNGDHRMQTLVVEYWHRNEFGERQVVDRSYRTQCTCGFNREETK